MAYAASMTGAATAAPVRAASAAAGKKSKKSPSTVNTNTPSMQDARAEAIERDSLSQRPPFARPRQPRTRSQSGLVALFFFFFTAQATGDS